MTLESIYNSMIPGSGKSSVFNTFESTFKGHITSRARTGDGSTVTTKQVFKLVKKNVMSDNLKVLTFYCNQF